MKYALIENGKVSNVIEWDGETDLGDLQPVAIPEGMAVDVGTSFDGTQFVPETPAVEPVVPTSVTMRQARLALLDANLLDAVETALAGAPRAAQIEWEFAATVERSSPTVELLAGVLGLDDEALGVLFADAASR